MSNLTLEVMYAADVVVQEKGGQLYHRLRLEQAIRILIPVLRELEKRASRWRFIYRFFLRGLIAALEAWVDTERDQAARAERLGLVTR